MQYWNSLRTPISGARRTAAAVLWATFVLAACDTLPSEPDTPLPPPSGPSDGPSRSVATVEVTPGGVVLVAGAWIRLHAEARDADGRLVTGNQVTWSSSNAEIADVLPTGFVIARGDGEASISATVAGKRGSARISVVQGPLEPPDDDGHDRVLR